MSSGHQHHDGGTRHDHSGPEARYAVEAEAQLPTAQHEEEIARGLELGLPAADSLVDRRISTFSRGELPHFAGINTFAQPMQLQFFLVTMIPRILPFMPTIQQIIQEFYLRCLLLYIRGNPSFPYYIP